MSQFLAELFGQTAKQQLKGEDTAFDPTTNSIERGALERASDRLFGREEEIQKLARDRQVRELKETGVAKALKRLGETVDVDSTMTEDNLVPQLRDAQETERGRLADAAYDKQYNRAGNKEARARSERMENRMLNQDLEAINARRDQTAMGMAQLDITRQQESNRMLEETRRYDQRRADSKKERMAALIAGLAQLGGAFTI